MLSGLQRGAQCTPPPSRALQGKLPAWEQPNNVALALKGGLATDLSPLRTYALDERLH